jgi:hypothetical protein
LQLRGAHALAHRRLDMKGVAARARRLAPVVAALAVACLGAAWPMPARAAGGADRRAEAHRHFQIGLDDVAAGAYKDAIVEFQRAYELSPNFAVLYNIAAAQEKLGDSAAALAALERYLAEAGAAIPAERRAKVEAEMRRHAARTGALVVLSQPPSARISIDGVLLREDQVGRAVRVNAGAHQVAAVHEGYTPAERSVTVAAGDTTQVTLALASLPVAPDPSASAPSVGAARAPAPPVEAPSSVPPAAVAPSFAPLAVAPPPAATPVAPSPPPAAEGVAGAERGGRPPGRVQRILGYLAGGAGLAGIGAGVLLYLDARSSWKLAIQNNCTSNAGCPEPAKTYWNDAQRGVTSSRFAFAGGGVLLAGGLVLVLAAPSGEAPRATPAAARATGLAGLRPFLIATDSAAAVAVTGRW